MRMIDFEYNGKFASSLNLAIGFFDGANEEVSIANNITINKVKSQYTDKYYPVGYSYDDVLTAEFSIVKDPCADIDYYFTDKEINEIVRWLNRKTYYKFKPIYDDDSYPEVYCEGMFNVSLVKTGDKVVGFKLNLITNAPYCFVEPFVFDFESQDRVELIDEMGNVLTTHDNVILVYDIVEQAFDYVDEYDNYGYTYCDIEIELLEGGDLTIYNVYDNNDIVIKNCKIGEKISLLGSQKIIESTNHDKLYNDFNYNYMRMVNREDNHKNEFHSNLDIEAKITYTPIRKVGLVV